MFLSNMPLYSQFKILKDEEKDGNGSCYIPSNNGYDGS
jgi:hypothetical protein